MEKVMIEWMTVFIAGFIVLATFTVEGIAGFGSTVMALPFIAMLIGIDKAVPMLSSLNVILSIFIVLRSWKNADLKEYKFILLHVGLGVTLGLLLMDKLPKEWLIGVLVCFMFFVASRGLYGTLRAPRTQPAEAPGTKKIFYRLILFLGGIIQGAFSSGGPVVVMYASKALTEKSKFRATLSSLWLTTNTCMIIKWTLSGTVWTLQLGTMILCALPFVLCGMFLGDYLHHKTDQRKFSILVYCVLMGAAFMLAANLLRTAVLR